MKRTTILAAALAVASLAGCDHGLGVSARSERSVTTEAKIEAGTETKTGATKTQKTTISMPALALAMDALRDLKGADPQHQHAAGVILATVKPVYGWPVACFGCAAQDAWARQQAQRIAFADLVLTQTLASLPTGALADPAAAKAAIRASFLAIPDTTLQAAWGQARITGPVTENFAGGEGVKYVIGTSAYEGGPAGWTWHKNGAAWYGDGAIGGQKMELALDSAIDTGVSTSTGTHTSTGTGTSKSTGADAGVK